MDGLWEALHEPQVPKTLANAEQVKKVSYDGDRVTARGAVVVGVTEFEQGDVANLPMPLRDAQLIEERLRTFRFDHITMLTSAQKDAQSKPRFQNVFRAIQDMRETLGSQGLLFVFISTHGIVEDGCLNLVPTDGNAQTHDNMLRVDELSKIMSPNRERALLVVDYSSHHRETAASFPRAAIDQPVPGPAPRIGFSFISSPPRLGSSFTVKLANMLDELIERKLPICPNSLFAIFTKHSQRWFGTPEKQMVLMSDRAPVAPSGKLPLVDWDYVSGIDTSAVSYTLTFSQAAPMSGQLADLRAMSGALKQAVPRLQINNVFSGEEQRRFVVTLSGGHATRGPREDKAYYAKELRHFCEERSLPHVEVIKAWFDKLICITSAANLESVVRGLQSSVQLKSFATHGAAPAIEYVGLLCRVEVTSTYKVHLQLDDICRKRSVDPRCGVIVEEVGLVEDKTHRREASSSARIGQQVPSEYASDAHGAGSRPHTPSAQSAQHLPKLWPNPGRQPEVSEDGSPTMVKASARPSFNEQAGGASSSDVAALHRLIQQERAERTREIEELRQQLVTTRREKQQAAPDVNPQELRTTLTQLQLGQEAVGQRVAELERGAAPLHRRISPQRGGATLEISNDEWMVYQDQLKLLQVQIRDVQKSIPAHGIARGSPPPTHRQAFDRNFDDNQFAQKIAMDDDPVATRRLQVQQRQLEEDVRIIQNQIASLMQTRCVGGFQSANSPQVMLAAAARDGTPTVEDVRMLRQRVERIEALGNGPHDVQHLLADDHAYGAKSNLEVKVDMLQHVLDKVLVGQQAGTPRGRTTQHDVTTTTDIRKVYNDMMIEDIDAQLQGRMPGMAGSQAPAYLPTGLRTAIQSMVGGMISTVKDQIEKWASSQLGYQRDQLGALNTATAEQLLGVQSKMSMIEETLSGLHHHHIFQRDKDASQHTPERANQLQSALAAISNLEQSVHNVQNTVTSHGSRLQNAELSLDNHVSELQNTLGDLRSRVDGAVTRFGTSVMDIEQRLMKDVTDAAARVTVADQRINHLDNRLNEDADRIHRLEDRVEQSVRQLQDRVDEQGQKIFDSERKLAQTLDEKVAVMRQIAELSEKQTLEVERKWHEAEALLKSQLRAALQQHIEGLEEVLQCMRNDLRGIEERVGMAETIGADAKNHASALDQRTMMLEKSLEALRTGFETYVHDGTVHIMQAHNERMEELRDKLGHELDLFDGRIKSIELQRKAADEELATALEKIQIAVAGQPSHERIEKALQSLEENKVRPAMETAVKSYELARELHIIPQRMDQLGEQVHACMVDNKAQIDAHREKSMEISMLKDQVMILRDQMQHSYHPPPVQSPPPPMPSGPATSGGNPQFEAEASRRLSELERQITDISTLRQDTTSLREELRVIREQRAAAPVSQPQAYSPPPSTTQAAPASGGDDQLRARIDAVEARLSEFDSKLEEQDQVTQEMVDTIAEHHTTIQSLRSKSKDTSGDADFELITADISKLKRTLSDVRKDVDVLKGWKTGKEGDAAVMERTARDVTDLKNKVSQLQLDVASIKPSD